MEPASDPGQQITRHKACGAQMDAFASISAVNVFMPVRVPLTLGTAPVCPVYFGGYGPAHHIVPPGRLRSSLERLILFHSGGQPTGRDFLSS